MPQLHNRSRSHEESLSRKQTEKQRVWMEELEGRVLLSAAVLDLSHVEVRRGTGEAEFQFEAEKGRTYLFFETEGYCSLHLTDQDGVQVAEEDSPYYRINWTAEESGTYYLWLDGDEEDPKGRYELLARPFSDDFGDTPKTAAVLSPDRAIHGEIEDFPDRDVFKFSAKEGERWAFEMSGDGIYTELRNSSGHVLDLGDGAEPMPYTGSYYVIISSSGGIGEYTLKARQVIDREGDREDATPLPMGKTIRGSTDFASDEDWFKFDAVAGNTYTFDAPTKSEWDSMRVEILDSEGKWLTYDSEFDDGNGRLEWVAAADGQYYLRVSQDDQAGYTISSAVTKPADVLAEGTARNVASGGSMSGALASPGDVAYFAFRATERGTYHMHLGQSAMKAGLMISIFDVANINSGGQEGDHENQSVEISSPDWDWLTFVGGDYYVAVRSYNPVETGTFSIGFEEELDAQGDSAEEAAPLEVGAAVDARSQYSGDQDWFALQVKQGERYVFNMQGHGEGLGEWHGSGHRHHHYWQDANAFELYDSSGERIGGGENYPALTAKAEWTAPADETIYINVSAYYGTAYTFLMNKAEADPQPATPLKVGEVASGRFEKKGESRQYRIALEPGKIYVTDVQLDQDSGISNLRAVEGFTKEGALTYGDAGNACGQWTWSVSEPIEYFVDLVSWDAGDFSAQIREFDPTACVAPQETPQETQEPVTQEVDPDTYGKLSNWRDDAVYWFRLQEGKSYDFVTDLDKDEWVTVQLYGPDDQWMAYSEDEFGTSIIWKAHKSGIYQLVISATGAAGFDLSVRQRFSDKYIELSSKELTPRHHRIISDDEEEDDSQVEEAALGSDENSPADDEGDGWEEDDSSEDDWNVDNDVPDWWDVSDWDV